MQFKTIGVNEIEKYVKKPGTKLIDLRSRKEYQLHHLEGAVNIPYDDLEKYKKHLSPDFTYVLYCERGGSSLMAAKELSQEGYRVYTVIGGISAWIDRNLK